MDSQQYLRFYRILLDSNRDENSIWQILDDIYADGYMDRHEYDLLAKVAKSDSFQIGNEMAVFVDSKSQGIIQKILGDQIFHAERYKAFRLSADVPIRNVGSISLNLEDLQAMPGGGFKIVLSLRDQDFEKKLEFALPDSQGKYPDGSLAGFDKALGEDVKKRLTSYALRTAFENLSGSFDALLLQQAYDAASRMGVQSQSSKPKISIDDIDMSSLTTGNGYSAETNRTDEIARLVESKATVTLEIYGIPFKLPPAKDWTQQIESTLATYPSYLLKAWAKTGVAVYLFDPSEIHPELFARGVLKYPSEAAPGWAARKKNKIFLSVEYLYELPHELSHALDLATPNYLQPLSNTWGFEVGLSKTYTETLSRLENYPEEVFAETYEHAGIQEQIAELPVIYYGQHGVSATSKELSVEEPMAYLYCEMTDEILKRHDYSDDSAGAPPIWLAYTETARVFMRAYLERYHSDWNKKENLAFFRESILQIDFTGEIDFWKSQEQFREFYDWETVVDHGLSKVRYAEVADMMANLSPESDFLKRQAYVARLHLNLQIGHEVSIIIDSGEVEPVTTKGKVERVTTKGVEVSFVYLGRQWKREISCMNEPAPLYDEQITYRGFLRIAEPSDELLFVPQTPTHK